MSEQGPTAGQATTPHEQDATQSASRELPRMATAGDLERLAGALADAFYEDPIFGWLMPDDRSRIRRLRGFFAIELRHVALRAGVAWAHPDLSGAAISTPPGAWRMPLRAVLAQGPVFGAHISRAARMAAAMDRRHLRQPHHYFAYIGVERPAQGKGLGTSLMAPTLAQCDKDGLPSYLEASSERNAALYERLGFRITRELRVAGSPPLRLMLRTSLAPGGPPSGGRGGSLSR